jgi:ABC-type Fe3+/spermidine/putrescine transport system ATPase subunit
MAEAGLRLEHLTKRFDDHVAVADLSLDVAQGSVLALLGPSGSGKTTTLRLIAGFERPDAGRVVIGGNDVSGLGPADRRFGMVFQHYALFPHLTVGENVAFGLDRGMSPGERRDRVAESLALVDLAGFEPRVVSALSGGQQQRVAVARAVAPRPLVLLFDEPLSNLDPALRERTRRLLRTAIGEIGVTTVFVTHEQEEAFALGDVIAVLRDGRLEQVGASTALYEKPSSEFVATFVGRASTLPGVATDGGRVRVATGVEWPASSPAPLQPGQAVAVTVRPEALVPSDEVGLRGTVTERRYVGARAYFTLETELGPVEFEASVRAANVGDTVWVNALACRAFPVETG